MQNILDNINSVRRVMKHWMNNRPWFQAFKINANNHDMPRFDPKRFAMRYGSDGLNFGCVYIDNQPNGPND